MPEQDQTIAYIHEVNGVPWSVPLKSDRVVIGRSVQADIVLDRSSVSRRHAELSRDPVGRWWVRDLESRSGIQVNHQQVEKHLLQPGDTIQISRFKIELSMSPADDEKSDIHTTVVHAAPDSLTANTHLSVLKAQENVSIGVGHLARLKEFAEQLAGAAELSKRRELLCQFVVNETFRGESATVMRLDNPHPDGAADMPLRILCGPVSPDSYSLQAVEHAEDDAGPTPYVSQTLIRAMTDAGTPVLANNTHAAEGQIEITLAGDDTPMAAAAIPLGSPRPQQDLLYITLPAELGSADWLALMSLAASRYEEADAQWKARAENEAYQRLEGELKKAHEIQMGLVPKDPRVEGLSIAIDFRPCAFVGGDYVDVVPMADGRTLLILADVTGHGLPAALVAQSLHSIIRMSHRWSMGLDELVAALNDHLCQTLNDRTFVTLLAIAIDTATGEFDYVNAGHPPALIIDPTGSVEQLNAGDYFPVGITQQDWTSQRGKLEPGQAVMVYSDGLIEIQDDKGRLFGIEGLTQEIAHIAESRPPTEVDDLTQDILGMIHKMDNGQLQADDRCFFIASRTG
ncbi:MAG: SpoIIE family protein phosphatase [Planctomycetota bacterium]|jgi:serine phosphatase RsbU (regulator of sigma subunit)